MTGAPTEAEWRAFLDWYAIEGLPVWRKREQCRRKMARYRAERPEHFRVQNRKHNAAWRAQHPDAWRAAQRRYQRAYYWRDPERSRTRTVEYARRRPSIARRGNVKQALIRKLNLKGTRP